MFNLDIKDYSCDFGKKFREHDSFTKTINVENTIITYIFKGGEFSKTGNQNNFEIVLATYVHHATGLQVELVHQDMLVGASEQLAKWCEEQVIFSLENFGVYQCL